jgi:hypothetical protein
MPHTDVGHCPLCGRHAFFSNGNCDKCHRNIDTDIIITDTGGNVFKLVSLQREGKKLIILIEKKAEEKND